MPYQLHCCPVATLDVRLLAVDEELFTLDQKTTELTGELLLLEFLLLELLALELIALDAIDDALDITEQTFPEIIGFSAALPFLLP